MTSVIVGARRIEHLNDNLGAVDIAFTPKELPTLDLVSHLPAKYPGWMLGMWRQARLDRLAKPRSAHIA